MPTFWTDLTEILSKHTTWTAIIGFVTSGLVVWTFYKDFWEGPNIRVFAGDSIDLVKSTDSIVRKIQAGCTFTNLSRKMGIVTKVALVIKSENVPATVFEWHLFYRYEGGHRSLADSKVCPIPVPGNGSTFQGIEFETKESVKWDSGKYHAQVTAWIGEDDVSETPSVVDDFYLTFGSGYVADLIRKETLNQAGLRTVMIDGREIDAANLKKQI